MVSIDNDDQDQSLDINRIAAESCDASCMRITRQIICGELGVVIPPWHARCNHHGISSSRGLDVEAV